MGPGKQHRLIAEHAMTRRIELESRNLDRIVGRLRGAPAQHRFDARIELARAERLGQVIVGAGFETRELVLLVGARGEHDQRHGPGAFVGTQPPRKFDAAHARQHPVEHHQVGQRGLHHLERLLGAFRTQRLMPGKLQVVCNQLLDRRFVLHHQYRCRHTCPAPNRMVSIL